MTFTIFCFQNSSKLFWQGGVEGGGGYKNFLAHGKFTETIIKPRVKPFVYTLILPNYVEHRGNELGGGGGGGGAFA